jgi:hypothetical protein
MACLCFTQDMRSLFLFFLSSVHLSILTCTCASKYVYVCECVADVFVARPITMATFLTGATYFMFHDWAVVRRRDPLHAPGPSCALEEDRSTTSTSTKRAAASDYPSACFRDEPFFWDNVIAQRTWGQPITHWYFYCFIYFCWLFYCGFAGLLRPLF